MAFLRPRILARGTNLPEASSQRRGLILIKLPIMAELLERRPPRMRW